jgi:TolB protein
LTLLAGACIAALGLTGLATAAQGSFHGQNGKIAFARHFRESTFDRKIQIWSVNPDGSGQTVVNDTSGYDLYPAWSPNGGKIAFARVLDPSVDSTFEIYVMNADGTGATRLTTNSTDDVQPSWSPDGGKLAFTAFRGGNHEIYAMNADGTGQVDLTNNPAEDLDPAWSPGGNKIAFSTTRNGKYEIDVMNADGTGQVNLTANLSGAADPAWSPDGQKIAFGGFGGVSNGVYVMNPDGSGANLVVASTADVSAGDPVWSPDGEKLAFVRSGPRCGVGCSPQEIWVADSDGSNQIQLTNTGPSLPNSGPDWQPLPGYPHPAGGAQFRVPLAIAYQPCTPASANETHGPALSAPSCNPGRRSSTWMTTGPDEANGLTPQLVGYLRVTVCSSGHTASGVCSTPATLTTPDVRIEANITDVRCAVGSSGQASCEGGALSDYTGQLQGNIDFRVTDLDNTTSPGSPGTDAGTMVDLPLPVTIPCGANPSGGSPTAIGASCSVVTSVNSFIPNAIPHGKRGNWEFGQAQIFDGGRDGVAGAADATPFLRQGIFVP